MNDFVGRTAHFDPHHPHNPWLAREIAYGSPDEMHGTSGDDTFSAGAGADTIYAGMGHDIVNGGSDDDRIYASAFGADGVVATWGNDVVAGGGGNDVIYYGNNTDHSVIFGDNSDGLSYGGDYIEGGSGGDEIYGGWGSDQVRAGSGNDTIYGDFPSGWAVAGTADEAGNDQLHGGDGSDWIDGGGGHDRIWGDNGNDTIHGGGGNDNIIGGAGVDNLYGGTGADRFMFNPGDTGATYLTSDVIHDFNASTKSHAVWDTISFSSNSDGIAGTAANFGHINGLLDTSHNTTLGQDFRQAEAFAQNAMDHSNHPLTYEFVTDGTNGWLFADLDGHHGIDAAIELRGVTDFSYHNII